MVDRIVTYMGASFPFLSVDTGHAVYPPSGQQRNAENSCFVKQFQNLNIPAAPDSKFKQVS